MVAGCIFDIAKCGFPFGQFLCLVETAIHEMSDKHLPGFGPAGGLQQIQQFLAMQADIHQNLFFLELLCGFQQFLLNCLTLLTSRKLSRSIPGRIRFCSELNPLRTSSKKRI
jgi:hypothetical protein